MLKVTGWSLLLGAVALIAGLILFFAPPAGEPHVEPMILDAGASKVVAGTANVVDGALNVVLDPPGVAVVSFAPPPFAAANYAFLHIAVETSSADVGVMVSWTDAHNPQLAALYSVEDKSRGSLWIATAELPGWSGDIGAINLVITGRPGDSAVIRDLALHPASPLHQLQAIYSDLTAFEPWNRAAMNTYTGVTDVASFYPVMLATALFGLSLLAYGALLALSRGKLRFRRMNVALIFLACWIILDIAWQQRLWRQLAQTYHTFAGVESPQRRSVDVDAPLFEFASRIKPQMEAGSRIFVASTDPYNGMRVAYYLYPVNVYWSLHSAEVPYDRYLNPGDYIALINPSRFRYNRKLGYLYAPERANLHARLVYSDRVGTLVRLQ